VLTLPRLRRPQGPLETLIQPHGLQRGPNRQPPIEPLQETLVIAFLIDISSALEYLHAEKFVHRDLKSANILMFQRQARLLLPQHLPAALSCCLSP
jgi:serine/threonine protein kinase